MGRRIAQTTMNDTKIPDTTGKVLNRAMPLGPLIEPLAMENQVVFVKSCLRVFWEWTITHIAHSLCTYNMLYSVIINT